MPVINELNQLDALAQKELLDNEELSPVEITKHYLKKIEKINPRLNAVIHQMDDRALEQAENEVFSKGGVSGLPFLIKDLNNISGEPSTSGSKMLRGYIPSQSDEIVQRYKQAGLNFIGKTNTPEFGFLPTTEPEHLGPTRNPWDVRLSAGGSSGGAAAAVASGMIPFAHASDGGGSIRIPASCCGLFGFKPSRGRMPYSPYMNHYAVSHAVTRSVRDSAALLDVVSGKGLGDGYPSLENSGSFLKESNESPGKLRIAVSFDWDNQVSISKETKDAMNHTIGLLDELGHEIVNLSPQFNYQQFANDFITAWIACGAVIIKHMGDISGVVPSEDNLEKLSYGVLKKGEAYSALFYEEARIRLEVAAKKIALFQEHHDVLLTPVMNKLPVPLGELKYQNKPVKDMLDNMLNYCSFTQFANVSGQPSMSMPLYWTKEGIPIGTQLTGRLGEDVKLFQLAKQLEETKPWFHMYENCEKNFA